MERRLEESVLVPGWFVDMDTQDYSRRHWVIKLSENQALVYYKGARLASLDSLIEAIEYCDERITFNNTDKKGADS